MSLARKSCHARRSVSCSSNAGGEAATKNQARLGLGISPVPPTCAGRRLIFPRYKVLTGPLPGLGGRSSPRIRPRILNDVVAGGRARSLCLQLQNRYRIRRERAREICAKSLLLFRDRYDFPGFRQRIGVVRRVRFQHGDPSFECHTGRTRGFNFYRLRPGGTVHDFQIDGSAGAVTRGVKK